MRLSSLNLSFLRLLRKRPTLQSTGGLEAGARTCLHLVAAAIAGAAPAHAWQANAPRTAAEEFDNVAGLRELPDGRLLVSQKGRYSRLVILDFARQTATPIGRMGRGPGEFENAGSLHAIGGDSTLLEAGLKRWLILKGSAIVRTSLPDDPAVMAVGILRGADTLGRLLSSSFGSWQDDSTKLVIVERSSGRLSSVAALSIETEPGYPPKPTPTADGIAYGVYPWSVYEATAFFPDGWIAISRLNPYRIDWRSPGGKWFLGSRLAEEQTRIDASQKAWFMASNVHAAEARLARSARGRELWPKYVPPFARWFTLIPLPDGSVAVRRSQSARFPESRYDVIDRSGRLRRQIVLGENEELRLVGLHYAYVVVTSDDGIQRIRRYPVDHITR